MEIINTTSESEQMYLVTIARLGELVDECPIPISKLAELLDVTPISANQMVHQLQQAGLVNYTPYKGVDFTPEGWQCASDILRTRRLWEVFLVQHLQYHPEEAGVLACRLEHAIPAETAERLAEFLNWPQVSPKGKPIPQSETNATQPAGIPLSNLSAGTSGIVSAILSGEAERAFLQQAGVTIGSQLEVLGNLQNGACFIQSDNESLSLSAALAQKIQIKTKGESYTTP